MCSLTDASRINLVANFPTDWWIMWRYMHPMLKIQCIQNTHRLLPIFQDQRTTFVIQCIHENWKEIFLIKCIKLFPMLNNLKTAQKNKNQFMSMLKVAFRFLLHQHQQCTNYPNWLSGVRWKVKWFHFT